MTINCKMCGTANADGIQFCQACGSALSGNQAEPARDAERRKAAPAKTMMFGQAPQAPQPQAPAPMAPMAAPAPVAAPAPAPTPTRPAPARTVLGMQSPVGQAAPTAPVAPMAAVPMARPVVAAPVAAPAAQAASTQNRTMLGMRAVTGAAVADAIAQAKSQTAAQAVARTPQAPRPEDVETMAASPTAAQSPALAEAVARSRMETAPLEPVPQHVQAAHAASRPDEWPDDDEDDRRKPARRGSGLLIIALVAGVVILGGLVVLFLGWRGGWLGGGGDLQPQVFPNPAGGAVTVALPLPEAPPGAAIQVQGQQVPVLGGQARFDLPLAPLNLGTNEVEVTYTAPGRAPEVLRFPISLRHKTAEDLAGLATADPYFEVVFQTAPGIQLAVAGVPVQSVGGVYRHRVALAQVAGADDPKADSLIHPIPFQLTGSGGVAEQGQHVVTLPLARLQIDRPGLEAVVVRQEVTVAGASEEGAQVTVNGEPVGVTASGFSTTVALPDLGEHVIQVTARAPGKAPRMRRIKVTRVADLAPMIEDWSRELSRQLDYPAIARDPNLHVDKKVALSGRVVNINTEKGVTAFLLYIGQGCPAGARCAVYVDYSGETDAGLQSNVTVYGVVGGSRDVDLRGGGKETMPSIKAKFVVLDEAPRPKQGRR